MAPLTRPRVIEMLNNFANGIYQNLLPEIAGAAARYLQQSADRDLASGLAVAAEMPRYKSIKMVHALEVAEIVPELSLSKPGEDYAGLAEWYLVRPADAGYVPVRLKGEVFSRYMPVPGDFIVQYADGYWSVSPRKAFIEGYVRVPT